MWLRAPEEIENALWEGPLEPASDEIVDRARREAVARGVLDKVRDKFRSLPLVSIAQPETWSLPELYASGKMPNHIQAKLEEADFYLVRLACSFRPRGHGVQIPFARFLVHLLPDTEGRQPIAFDLHPQQVYQEVKHQNKISLSPSLNFQAVEVGAGGIEFGIEYQELSPIISAAGLQEPEPSWDYEGQKGIKLQGAKVMHLLVRAPKGMPLGEATLDLSADVHMVGILSAVLIRRQDATPLKAKLWEE